MTFEISKLVGKTIIIDDPNAQTWDKLECTIMSKISDTTFKVDKRSIKPLHDRLDTITLVPGSYQYIKYSKYYNPSYIGFNTLPDIILMTYSYCDTIYLNFSYYVKIECAYGWGDHNSLSFFYPEITGYNNIGIATHRITGQPMNSGILVGEVWYTNIISGSFHGNIPIVVPQASKDNEYYFVGSAQCDRYSTHMTFKHTIVISNLTFTNCAGEPIMVGDSCLFSLPSGSFNFKIKE